MSRVMISAAAYLLSFLFQSSLLWVFLPGATLWSKGGWGGGTQVNSWFKEPTTSPLLICCCGSKNSAKWEQDTEVSRTSYLNSENSNGAPPGGQWPLNPLQIQP